MKTLKICLVILCLLHVRAVGMPQFSGANFFMQIIFVNSPKYGIKEVLVDDEDLSLVSEYKWYVSAHKHTFYARTTKTINGKSVKIYLHRMLTGAYGRNKIIDHRDHNGLNNQRYNIRECTQSQNLKNRTARKVGTGYLGVGRTKTGFRAFIMIDGKFNHLGNFKDAIEAAKAYDKAAIANHGSFANPNLK